MSHDKNDELRDAHRRQEQSRQKLRDEVLDEDGQAATDLGSQDERREHPHRSSK